MMKSKVFDAQMELMHRNEALTIDNFKEKLLELEQRSRMLIPIFPDHNNKIKDMKILRNKFSKGIQIKEEKYSI